MILFRFNDLPIRRKLILIIVTVSAIALLLARAGMMIYEFKHFRDSLARDLPKALRCADDTDR